MSRSSRSGPDRSTIGAYPTFCDDPVPSDRRATQRGIVGAMPAPRRVFISYSRKDRTWKDSLRTQLAALDRHDRPVQIWVDDRISWGAPFRTEILEAIWGADLAVLLISADSLASRFINEVELVAIDKRGLPKLPILLRDCGWKTVPWLEAIDVRPRDAVPLARHPEPDRAVAELVSELDEFLDRHTTTSAGAASLAQWASESGLLASDRLIVLLATTAFFGMVVAALLAGVAWGVVAGQSAGEHLWLAGFAVVAVLAYPIAVRSMLRPTGGLT